MEKTKFSEGGHFEIQDGRRMDGYIKNVGKNMFLEGGHFEIQDGGWMHGCTTIFPQNFCSSRCIVLVI